MDNKIIGLDVEAESKDVELDIMTEGKIRITIEDINQKKYIDIATDDLTANDIFGMLAYTFTRFNEMAEEGGSDE